MTQPTATRVLGLHEAVNLAIIIQWTWHTTRIKWLDERNEVRDGTARCIGDEQGNFLAANEDVRDAFLRITTSSGFEWFVPVSDVLERVQAGTMVQDSDG